MSVEEVQKEKVCSVERICKRQDMTRDAYYKTRKRMLSRKAIEGIILSLIKDRRKELAREGGRKLHKALQSAFQEQNVYIGRDKLFDLLRANNMLVRRKKSYHRTTNSNHRFRKYPNLIKDLNITGPNQVWVSDITYIKLVKGHCYLALITDVYSRKIVGYDLSDSLELMGCLRALKQALRHIPAAHNLIHHSDRGVQYCSYIYTELLQEHKIRISMTEENHCYENAIAERVNGILKDEFYLDYSFDTTLQAQKVCRNAVNLYNHKRLHLSLNYQTPDMVHKLTA